MSSDRCEQHKDGYFLTRCSILPRTCECSPVRTHPERYFHEGFARFIEGFDFGKHICAPEGGCQKSNLDRSHEAFDHDNHPEMARNDPRFVSRDGARASENNGNGASGSIAG